MERSTTPISSLHIESETLICEAESVFTEAKFQSKPIEVQISLDKADDLSISNPVTAVQSSKKSLLALKIIGSDLKLFLWYVQEAILGNCIN